MRPRDRRAAVIGGAALFAVLAVRAVIVPYLHLVATAHARAEAEELRLRRERALVRDSRGYRAEFDTLAAHLLGAVPRLLRDGASAELQANLSRRVDETARAVLVDIARTEALPSTPGGHGITTVSLRVEGEGDYAGFLEFVAALEAGPTTLHLHDLDVRARESGTAPGPAGAASAVLSFRVTITAFAMEWASSAGRTAAGTRPSIRRAGS
ncbi:MAG TPA: GspMb/PilO family protein [Longimicrobium sp.]|jgi:hypothetical protein